MLRWMNFADVWNDSTKIELVISSLLFYGTQSILERYYDRAQKMAICARYMEQYVAIMFHKTQTLICWPKVEQMSLDMHTLVKFYRHRISCSCLDEKYEEVKDITKMGVCCNEQCNVPYVERSKTKYCSRCRCVVYCSRECQKVDWTNHRAPCDRAVAMKAKVEVEAKEKS
mmetsp:Transcript_26980/g.42318  ORF Transcript_26980/g.42318 Transcript_26980/m.42318 type:complete len:171 (+) Transcript_26980:241-753(+)